MNFQGFQGSECFPGLRGEMWARKKSLLDPIELAAISSNFHACYGFPFDFMIFMDSKSRRFTHS